MKRRGARKARNRFHADQYPTSRAVIRVRYGPLDTPAPQQRSGTGQPDHVLDTPALGYAQPAGTYGPGRMSGQGPVVSALRPPCGWNRDSPVAATSDPPRRPGHPDRHPDPSPRAGAPPAMVEAALATRKAIRGERTSSTTCCPLAAATREASGPYGAGVIVRKGG